jgi:anti-sigma factor RsiW
MSCPHEWQLSAYVDGGLEGAEARALESHLVGCAACRRSVLALRDEARVLRELVHERLPAPVAPAEAGRGIALGFPIAVGVLALASFGAGALIESLPRPVRWLAPSESLGVSRMLIDVLFTVRNNFSAWFDFAFAVAALGVVAGLAYVAADRLLRRSGVGARTAVLLLGLVALAGLAPQEAQAKFELREGDRVEVAADETLEGSLIATGDSVAIEGTVRGDVLAFGDRVRISGAVEGNVFCAGERVELAGSVRGSVHCAGKSVRVEGETQGNLYGAGSSLEVEPGAKVGGDLAVGCERCQIDGEVARDLLAAGESLELAGSVGRNVGLRGRSVAFRETARLPGAIDLRMPEGAEPDVASGAELGEIQRSVLNHDHAAGPFHRISVLERIRSRVVLAVSAFVVGLVLFAIAPGMFAVRVDSAGRFFAAVGLGFAALIVIPVALVLLLVSVLGIPVALFGGLLFCVFVFLGPIVVAAVVGRAVMRSPQATFRDFAIALAVGMLLLAVLTSLPVIGGVAFSVLILEGLGLLVLHAHEWWSERRAARALASPA